MHNKSTTYYKKNALLTKTIGPYTKAMNQNVQKTRRQNYFNLFLTVRFSLFYILVMVVPGMIHLGKAYPDRRVF